MIFIDPLLLFLAAMVIDLYAGDWIGRGRWIWHPSTIFGKLFAFLELKLNRSARGKRTLMVRGALTVLIGVGVAAIAGVFMHLLSVQAPLLWLIELTLILSLVDLRRPWRDAIALADALERDGLEGGRTALPALSLRDPVHTDVYEVARLGVEVLAARFAFGLIGPALSYWICGLSGLFVYQALILISNRPGESQPFYVLSNRLVVIVRSIASIIGAFILVLAAFAMEGAQPKVAFLTAFNYCRTFAGVKNGPTVAAMAGALGLSLEGPRRYVSGVIARPWVGGGTVHAGPKEILAATRLFLSGWLVVAILIVVWVVGS